MPREYGLLRFFPNPFNAETMISFELNATEDIRIDLYDVTGRKVRSLAAGRFPAGAAAVRWDGLDDNGRRVSSGVYFGCLRLGAKALYGKALLLK
jgi:hypothetical protein